MSTVTCLRTIRIAERPNLIWLEVETDVEAYRKWLEKYIYGVKEFGEYLSLCGGLARMQELRRQELLLNRGR